MQGNQAFQTQAEQAPLESQNRREHDRHTAKVDVTLESESTFYNGFTENISAGGLFVATYDVRPIGGTLNLEFTIPGRTQPVTVAGEIRWVREYNEMTPDVIPGMGVKFINLNETDQYAIEQFLAVKEPLFYDDEF